MFSWQNSSKLNRKNLFQITLFILAFGVVVALISNLLNNFIDPANNRYIQELLQYRTQTMVLYFAFVMIASVIVPIPTLPIDLLLFNFLDPATVVTIRVLGGLAGGSVGYYLSYNYGRPLLKRWLSRKNYETVETLSDTFSWREFFIITMIPVINAELMAYVGGLGKLGYRKTASTLFLGIAYRVVFVAAVTAVR